MTNEAATPDDEIDINLRTPGEVGVRLVILAALIRRLLLEADDIVEESAEEFFDLRLWFSDQQLDQQATTEERLTINADLGRLASGDRDTAELVTESLVPLAWVAGLSAFLPPFDQPATIDGLLDRLPAPWDAIQPFIAGLSLRPEEEIAVERERAELWLWRASIEADRLDARGSDRADLDTLIRATAQEARDAGIISMIQDGDFSIAGQPFRRLPAEQQDLVATTAAARLHALNWACGFGESWDEVPLDVP